MNDLDLCIEVVKFMLTIASYGESNGRMTNDVTWPWKVK